MTSPSVPPPPYQAKSKRPYVTYVLLLISVSAYVVEWITGQGGWVLTHLAHERVKVWDGQYWRLLTALFIHHSMVFHLAMNMLALLVLGRVIERVLGSWRFFVLYLASGIAGSLFFQAFSDGWGPALGASGAVYGVFGALALILTSRTATAELVPRWRFLGTIVFVVAADQVLAYSLEFGGAGVSLAVSAHLGGLVSGVALGYVLTPRPLGSTQRVRRLQVAVASAFVLFFAAVGVYGCLYTIDDANWRALTEVRALQVPLRERKFEEALEPWYGLRTQDEAFKRALGYDLYDGLMAQGRQDLAEKVLDELIASAAVELKVAEKQGPVSAARLNELAWLYALRGKKLNEAKKYAIEAVRIVQERRRENMWAKLFPNAQARLEESQYLNTRGWVKLQLSEDESAIEDLTVAAELLPIGAHFLYLAWAQEQLGDEAAAREAAGKAHSAGDLSLYESRVLEELRARLGDF